MAIRLREERPDTAQLFRPADYFSKRGIPMLQFIMEQNLLLYVCAVACALGVVSQFLLRHLYLRLISETQNTADAR